MSKYSVEKPYEFLNIFHSKLIVFHFYHRYPSHNILYYELYPVFPQDIHLNGLDKFKYSCI